MKLRTHNVPNTLLRKHRERQYWTQTELARMLGTTYLSVCRWENGTTSPSLYFRKRLCELFDLRPDELGLAPPSEETSRDIVRPPLTPAPWTIPYRRNPFFTGREHILLGLHTLLHAGKRAALVQAQAISGLGGIGKTQTAIEYAYRYREHYQAILWCRAETRTVLLTDLVALTHALDLHEKDEQDQERVVQAMRRWLQNSTGWLLILDNVEDLSLVEDVLPPEYSGHVLLTTRTQSTGTFAQRIDLEQMEPEEGALFLLRRAKLIRPDAPLEAVTEAEQAKEISRLLDGLPLALDQAGAYIEETGCSVADYLERYQTRRASLLQRRGGLGTDHLESVGTTISLALGKVERVNPASAELLRFCAFLDPDAIPEEILTEGASELGHVLEPAAADPVSLDAALADLRRYSLLRRNPDSKTLTIHRLVQAVLKDHMDERVQRQWAECCVRAVNRVFPEGEFPTWQRCQRLLPHVQSCATLIEQHNLASPEAARLLNNTGWYLLGRALYTQAESLLQRALAIREQVLVTDHTDTAATLNNLAVLSFYQGRFGQAELLYQRALAIRERVLGPEHPDTANTLDSLALLYSKQDRCEEAEPLYQRALAIEEKVLGPQHLDTGATLNNLALLYVELGRYEQAEPLYQRVLAIHDKTLGHEHPYTAIVLDNLAKLYYTQGRYAQAEPLYQRALVIEEKTVGLEHTSAAITLTNLAQLYQDQGQYAQAEPLYQRALVIKEKILGAEHPDTAYTLDKLAQLYQVQGRYPQAKSLLKRALTIREQKLGTQDPDTVATRERYAAVLAKT